MFLRRHVVTRGDKVYISYRLCRTVREGGSVRQQIVANLGKLSDAEAERIGRQLLAIAGKAAPPPTPASVQQGQPYLYGGPLLVDALMRLANLNALLQPLGRTRRRLDLPRTLSVALCAQLLAPGSDLSTSRWQEKLLCTRTPYHIPYHHFLRALDVLADHHSQIEEHLFAQVKHLFNQQVDVLFYDLTSSYFEGHGPPELARRGYSRDGRPDCPQIVLGIAVTTDGFPIAYRVHPGNTVDAATLQSIADDFRSRFHIHRCLVVGDSGLLSQENAQALDELGLGYLLGMRAATTRSAQQVIAAAAHLEPAGCLGEVSYWDPLLRDNTAYVLLHSPGRHTKTISILERKLAAVRPRLGHLERDVRAGKVRSEQAITARATRILVQAKASPYIELHIAPAEFSWCENAEKLQAMRQNAGRYVLQTNQLDLTAQEAAIAYRQLEVAEDCIRRLKDTLGLRPLYHRCPKRVIGHVGLCVIALFLLRLLEQRLLAAGLCHTAEQAIAAVQDLIALPIHVDGRELWPAPHVSATARAIFQALDVSNVKARFDADLQALGLPAPG